MTQVRIESVSKTFGTRSDAVAALDDVSLTVESGEFYFLLGPSGCGKTTLLRTIAGIVEADSGRIHFGNRDVTAVPVESRKTALVFQNYALWPHMTVGDNVAFGPKMQGLPRDRQAELARSNLERIQMAEYIQRRPNQLSGGQQQRVAVARALAAEPDVLLLDEPLSNLDAQLRLHMREELLELVKSTGMTAIYVTHDQKEALSMADRIAVMNAGRIVQIGRPEELYNRPTNRFIAEFLGEANIVAGRVGQTDPVVQINTPAGALLAHHCGLTVGQNVHCCLRPERISLDTTEPSFSSDNLAATFDATVLGSVYLGQARQYVCGLETGEKWKVSVLPERAETLAVGRKVRLRVLAEDVAVLLCR